MAPPAPAPDGDAALSPPERLLAKDRSVSLEDILEQQDLEIREVPDPGSG